MDEKNEGVGVFGMLTGGMITMFLISIWGPVIATFIGAIGTVISGMLLIIAKDFYEHKLKPKWFKSKIKQDEIENNKTDDSKAA